MIQIADLVLYPMAKGGYDPDNRPYRKRKESGKLIDCLLTEDQIPLRGIKYSCCDSRKNERLSISRAFKTFRLAGLTQTPGQSPYSH
jgi:hypothetical protein